MKVRRRRRRRRLKARNSRRRTTRRRRRRARNRGRYGYRRKRRVSRKRRARASNPGKRKRKRGRRRMRHKYRWRKGTRKAGKYARWSTVSSMTRRKRRRKVKRARNPALSLSRPLGMLTAGYNVSQISTAAQVVAGGVANRAIVGFVSGWLPSMLQSGIGNYAVGLGTAGVTGVLGGMVNGKLGSNMFFGGVLSVVMEAVEQYIMPAVGLSGLGDYLTVANAREAKPLGRLGDYLTVANAREARPLGNYTGDAYVSEELAAY